MDSRCSLSSRRWLSFRHRRNLFQRRWKQLFFLSSFFLPVIPLQPVIPSRTEPLPTKLEAPSLRGADNGGDEKISTSAPCHSLANRISSAETGHLSTTPHLYNFTTPHLYNSTSLQLNNFTTHQLYNLTTLQLNNFTC